MKSSTPRPGGEARAARRRQHVVGAGDVIADRLGRIAAEEDGAGIADLAPPALRRRRARARDAPARCRSTSGTASSAVAHQDDRAVASPALARDRARAAGVASCALDRRRDRVGEAGIVGDEDRLRRRVVLGLRQQIGGDPGGIVVRDRRRPGSPTGRRSCRCRPCRRRGAWRRRHRRCRARRSCRPAAIVAVP